MQKRQVRQLRIGQISCVIFTLVRNLSGGPLLSMFGNFNNAPFFTVGVLLDVLPHFPIVHRIWPRLLRKLSGISSARTDALLISRYQNHCRAGQRMPRMLPDPMPLELALLIFTPVRNRSQSQNLQSLPTLPLDSSGLPSPAHSPLDSPLLSHTPV